MLFLYETILIKKQNCVQIRIRKIPIEFWEKFQSNHFGPKKAGIGKKKSTWADNFVTDKLVCDIGVDDFTVWPVVCLKMHIKFTFILTLCSCFAPWIDKTEMCSLIQKYVKLLCHRYFSHRRKQFHTSLYYCIHS